MRIKFPKCITNTLKTYKFMIKMYHDIFLKGEHRVDLDFSDTNMFDTNFLSFLSIFIFECNYRGIKVCLFLSKTRMYENEQIPNKLFDYYADLKAAFVKPRCAVGNRNVREEEDLLIKFLKRMNLKEYNRIKTMISELLANIKMHVQMDNQKCRGYIASCCKKEERKLYISVVNNVKSIKDSLQDNNISFKTDCEAVLWSLKKTNSTRKSNETGGIGLYLLRKYISILNGEIFIVSGKAYIHMDERCYSQKSEDEIYCIEKETLPDVFNGTMITIMVPYDTLDSPQQTLSVSTIDLETMFENITEDSDGVP